MMDCCDRDGVVLRRASATSAATLGKDSPEDVTHESAASPAGQVDAVAADDLVPFAARDGEQARRHVEAEREEVCAGRWRRWRSSRGLLDGFGLALSALMCGLVVLAIPFEDAATAEVLAVARSCIEDESALRSRARRSAGGQDRSKRKRARDGRAGASRGSARQRASASGGCEKSRWRSRRRLRARAQTRRTRPWADRGHKRGGEHKAEKASERGPVRICADRNVLRGSVHALAVPVALPASAR